MYNRPVLLRFHAILLGSALCTVAYSQTLLLPPRPADAKTGAQVKAYLEPMALDVRENAIYSEVAAGNVPGFLRTLVAVTVTASVDSTTHTATYYVAPEYMALGSDDDYFLMPMTPILAQRVADLLKCNLPTKKMVNDLWSHAAVKLTPSPIPPSPAMTTIPVFWDHNITVRGQRAPTLAANPLGALVGGHKKDVVVTARLATNPGKVAIYGWHYPDGSYIQPLYLGHGDAYADYSHGIRMVQMALTVDGQPNTVTQVLADPTRAALLSDEGAFSSSRYPVPQPPAAGNLVVNGSFEDPFASGVGTGWTKWEAPGSAAITFGRATINRHDGVASQYWDRSDTTAFDGGVYQVVAVQAGRRYKVEAWMKRQSTFPSTVMKFGFDGTGGTNALAGSVTYQDLATASNDTWVQYSATVVATGAKLTLFARGAHSDTTGGASAYFYLDQVSLVADDAGTTLTVH